MSFGVHCWRKLMPSKYKGTFVESAFNGLHESLFMYNFIILHPKVDSELYRYTTMTRPLKDQSRILKWILWEGGKQKIPEQKLTLEAQDVELNFSIIFQTVCYLLKKMLQLYVLKKSHPFYHFWEMNFSLFSFKNSSSCLQLYSKFYISKTNELF